MKVVIQALLLGAPNPAACSADSVSLRRASSPFVGPPRLPRGRIQGVCAHVVPILRRSGGQLRPRGHLRPGFPTDQRPDRSIL